jgi:hypothetical protein
MTPTLAVVSPRPRKTHLAMVALLWYYIVIHSSLALIHSPSLNNFVDNSDLKTYLICCTPSPETTGYPYNCTNTH